MGDGGSIPPGENDLGMPTALADVLRIKRHRTLRIPLTLENSWAASGGGYPVDIHASVNHDGRVFIEGTVKDGALSTVIATLPAELRPLYAHDYIVDTGGINGLIQVSATGTIILYIGGTSKVSLDGISFLIGT
jgi:hypothetical protein